MTKGKICIENETDLNLKSVLLNTLKVSVDTIATVSNTQEGEFAHEKLIYEMIVEYHRIRNSDMPHPALPAGEISAIIDAEIAREFYYELGIDSETLADCLDVSDVLMNLILKGKKYVI